LVVEVLEGMLIEGRWKSFVLCWLRVWVRRFLFDWATFKALELRPIKRWSCGLRERVSHWCVLRWAGLVQGYRRQGPILKWEMALAHYARVITDVRCGRLRRVDWAPSVDPGD